ncbi:YggS family pyridoxal phosphate-dependent enzyme [Planctomicrobium sp. SH527]|uniref:YggS family pyridoxal phosphate-dependent enzyme n=1 Tax=Planctomicrobium sp. SH527 TaxID=3448123 RepID=UPI003F5C4F7D
MSQTPLHLRLSDNLKSVHDRIGASASRGHRSVEEISLIAVTKYAPWPAVLALLDLGHQALGENRPQQLIDRAEQVTRDRPTANPHWHLIGQLQRNKVRSVLPDTCLIHSIDSVRLLERVEQIAVELGIRPEVLLQVNVSGEESKGGFHPDDVQASLERWSTGSAVRIVGLMTMAPLTEDESIVRASFQGLRELRDRLTTEAVPLPHLSMGMSGDFEIAIEEGATLIRVGSAIFDGCEELV